MDAPHSYPWRWLLFGSLVLVSTFCRADDNPPGQDSNLDVIHYKTPAGWQATDRPGQAVRSLVAPDSTVADMAVIVIMLSPSQDSFDLRATFDATVKGLTNNGKVLESSEVTTTKTRQGLDAVWQTLVTQGDGNSRLYVRMIGAKVQNRMAGIYFLATSKQRYELHEPDMDALLKSTSFDKADVAANPVPTDDQLLAKARERFAKGVADRRKPHTIIGDIIGVDGKPIPNVDKYRVFVWGTTIAAEKARYGLEVDAKGHFEQEVPDGLYQIKATCIVKDKDAGYRVPVDLAWLDDKQAGVDQASSKGIVRDFCLAMSGLMPGEDPKEIRSYFGGGIKVTGPSYTVTAGSYSTRHPGSKVQLTLTPKGLLIDGTRREPTTIDIDISELDYGSRPRKIPLGFYQLTATLIGKDGSKQALQCSRTFGGEYANSVDIFWECSRDDQETRVDPAIYVKD